jgi:Arc/MetJ-type ribon-helix-helix transcriptional regulator
MSATLDNERMKIALTKPIEQFIQRQLRKGYTSPSEVARQAFLRWMDEEEELPPHVQEKLDQAAAGRFRKGSRANVRKIIAATS